MSANYDVNILHPANVLMESDKKGEIFDVI